jgi:hypothetical protein
VTTVTKICDLFVPACNNTEGTDKKFKWRIFIWIQKGEKNNGLEQTAQRASVQCVLLVKYFSCEQIEDEVDGHVARMGAIRK